MLSRALFILWNIGVFFFLGCSDAEAFGPVTHVNLGCQILSNIGLLAPALGKLLQTHSHEFLYGNMAADVIIAKNLANIEKHCHNWEVGFGVLEEAQTDPQKAFAWGYLCHLAADVIAHNYFVPWKLVEGYPARTTGHAYWEIRLDQKSPPAIWRLMDRISRQRFPEQQGLLARTIEGTLFRFETNLTIFNGMLFVQRLERWRALLDRVERRSPWFIKPDEAEQILQLAAEAVLELLLHQREAKIYQADPTGIRNLHIAKQLRRSLRKTQSRMQLDQDQVQHILETIRQKFLAGVHLPFQPHHWPEDLKNPSQFLWVSP